VFASCGRNIPLGSHGRLPDTRKATGLERRTPAAKTSRRCHGEFCSLAPALVRAAQLRRAMREEAVSQQQRLQEESKKQKQHQTAKSEAGGGPPGAAGPSGGKYINFGILISGALKAANARQQEDAKLLAEASIVSSSPYLCAYDD
jgi:hypothetical protein